MTSERLPSVGSMFRAARLLAASSVFVVAVAGTSLAATQVADLGDPTGVNASDALNNPPRVQTLVQQANDAIKRGDLRVATLLLRNALQIVPKNATIRTQLGSVLLRQGDSAGAEREVRQARNDGAPDGSVLPILFQAMITRDKFRDLLDQFPEPPPNDKSDLAADILRARAIAFQRLGQIPQANAAIDKSLAVQRTALALLTKAQLAQNQGNPALAASATDEALKLDPKEPSLLIMKIGLLQSARAELGAATPNKGGHREKAMQLIDQAIGEIRAGIAFAGG